VPLDIGQIRRVDLTTGLVSTLKLELVDANDALDVDQGVWFDGQPVRTDFHWPAVRAFRPERSIVTVTLGGATQAILQFDEAVLDGSLTEIGAEALYVCFLEVAPWNRPEHSGRRFAGLGAGMIAAAVERSRQLGKNGRVGLHSVLVAVEFYERLGFVRSVSIHDNEYWEPYYELSPEAASRLSV
jgi:GNAT superfamily N-acetyltransferase